MNAYNLSFSTHRIFKNIYIKFKLFIPLTYLQISTIHITQNSFGANSILV